MESLLRWGIENSAAPADDAPSTDPPRQLKELDPAIIDAILGKSDADEMREQLAVAVDESKPIDDRTTALDNFEMLVESIDNANNLVALKMWEPLIQLSKSSDDEIQQYGLWIIGTAIQNNPKAQHAVSYLSYNPLPQLISILSPSPSSSTTSTSPTTRSKAVYCISNALRHNARAVQAFDSLKGWAALSACLQDSSVIVRRKVAFLLLTLLLQDGPSSSKPEPISLPPSVHTNLPAPLPEEGDTDTDGAASRAIASSGIVSQLLKSLVSPVPSGPDGDEGRDADFEEKSIKVVLQFVRLGVVPLQGSEKEMLATVLSNTTKDEALERWVLEGQDWVDLQKASQS
ncbi:Fes1-domain-containing protein [Clavulina sp. PMI_390]|nr:Fes1-domain-containing protein [Clavulina sp. PMI_390]